MKFTYTDLHSAKIVKWICGAGTEKERRLFAKMQANRRTISIKTDPVWVPGPNAP